MVPEGSPGISDTSKRYAVAIEFEGACKERFAAW